MRYWSRETSQRGEATREEIRAWIDHGMLSPDTEVSKDGSTWIPFSKTEENGGIPPPILDLPALPRLKMAGDPVTKKQLAYLYYLGVREAPLCKAEASMWIDQLHRGEGISIESAEEIAKRSSEWVNVRHFIQPELYKAMPTPEQEAMDSIERSRREIIYLRRQIKEQKSLLKKAEDEDEKSEIQEFIDELFSSIEGENEYISEEKRSLREEAKARLHDLWEAMGPSGYWSHSIKRPTKNQVRQCMEELDQEGQRWDDGIATALYDRLIEKFPDLRKKTRARHGDDYYTVFHSMDVHIGDGNEHAKALQVPFAADLAAEDTDDFYTKTARRRRRKEKEAEEIRQGITIAMIVLLALATVIILVKSFS